MWLRHRSIMTFILLFLLASISLAVCISEIVFREASGELEEKLLADTQDNVRYISEAFYSQLTDIRLQNYDILTQASVRALSAQRPILDDYEVVERKTDVIRYFGSKMSQYELIHSICIYIPALEGVISNLSAVQISAEEAAAIQQLTVDFPDGIYYTGDHLGFWSTYPLIFPSDRNSPSRIVMTEIRRSKLVSLLDSYKRRMSECELILSFDQAVLAQTGDMDWVSEQIQFGTADEASFRLSNEGEAYYVVCNRLDFDDLSICAVLPIDALMGDMYKIQWGMRCLEGIGALVIVLWAYVLYRMIYRPLRHITQVIQRVGAGDLDARIIPQWSMEFNAVSIQFNNMTKQLQQLIEREYKYKLLAAKAEMKQLQYQISPHFLFNTYFQLRNLILVEDNENAGKLADLMGEFLRYTVHMEQEEATLEEEILHARVYADIQQMRFQGRIRVEYDIKGEQWKRVRVPRLIVQPLIENAFGHGLKSMQEDGLVRVSLLDSGRSIDIAIEDNGTELSETTLEEMRAAAAGGSTEYHGGIALVNIHRRLQFAFGGNSGLKFGRAGIGGMRAVIHIEMER